MSATSSSSSITLNLNRFHRLSLWCRDCDAYWQLPNYLVVLHGTCDGALLRRLMRLNLYLYRHLLELCIDEVFGELYSFEDELRSVFDQVKQRLHAQSTEIRVLDVDIISSLEENMPTVVDFVLQMRGSFDTMAAKVIDNSPRNFLHKLDVLRKNITRSLDSDNVKCALDNLMDLNIAGLDTLVQCVGIIFNCFYILGIDIVAPDSPTPGIKYCQDPAVIIERLANISAQNFLYKYKRRWLVFYREILSECKSLFSVADAKAYNELRLCGNYETIEAVLYDLLITKNEALLQQLTILRHRDRYPKSASDINDWWLGRSKEQLQNIYNLLDDCLGMDKKTMLLPFILTHGMPAKERMYYEILNVLRMFDRINPELSTAIGFIMRIYPEVYEQVYFPDRERYTDMLGDDESPSSSSLPVDSLDNVRDKNTLRKCENARCQAKNGGKRVIWNLNAFEVGKHSMNTVFKELIKNPRIFEEIFAYAQKNLNIAVNANSLTRKTKIIYKK